MRNTIIVAGALALVAAGSARKADAKPRGEGEPTRKLFLDIHEIGKGKVTAKDVADAHRKDLATQGKYGVDYKAYWVDEKEGKVYCLAEAPSAEAASIVHREAHGLLASKIMEVTADNSNWVPSPGMKLYMDVHHLGPGKVTAKDVAGAHKKDLAVGPKHNVTYLNYWLDAATGTVVCLSQAPSAEAAIAVHREAHGLIPDSIEQVSEGR
jgi:hypothetical protein